LGCSAIVLDCNSSGETFSTKFGRNKSASVDVHELRRGFIPPNTSVPRAWQAGRHAPVQGNLSGAQRVSFSQLPQNKPGFILPKAGSPASGNFSIMKGILINMFF